MSQRNVEIVRSGYERFRETGDFREEVIGQDFVWDMSTFRGWPEQQTYHGIEGARAFIRGRSKATGLQVDMDFGQLWTVRDGKQVRMEMYASPEETLQAAGLRE